MTSSTAVVTLATGVATVFGMLAVAGCMIYAPLIMREVNDVWAELDEQMDDFKVAFLGAILGSGLGLD